MLARLTSCCLLLVLATTSFGQFAKGKVAPGEVPFTPPKKWAMLIGASNYTELGKLSYAAKDATAFAAVLKDRFDFTSEAIELITDEDSSKLKPTIENVKKALDRQLADPRLNDGDLFIFYFSGHGIGTPRGDFIMPTNAGISDVEMQGLPIKDIVASFVKAGLKNVLFIADACRGGEKNSFGKELQELGNKANIAILLGCQPGARSYEYPRLGSGVFTNFLIKALADKEVRDPTSGALWASNVAESVQKKVFDYTQRDYPTAPQQPSSWTEKTQDLLLGAFSESPLTSAAISKIKGEATKLTPGRHAQALVTLADELHTQNRPEEVVSLLKTVDGIGQSSPSSLYTLAAALNDLGRSKEGAKVFYRLSSQTENPYFQRIAQMQNPDRRVLALDRAKAAKELWKVDKSWATAVLVWQKIKENGTASDKLGFLISATSVPGTEEWYGKAFAAEQSAMSGHWPEALAGFEAAIDQCTDDLSKRLLFSLVIPTVAVSEDAGPTKRLLAKMTQDPDSRKSAWVIEASLLASRGLRAEAVPILTKLLNDNPEPEHLYYAVRIAGEHLAAIAEPIERESRKFPYAWRAIAANGLVKLLVRGDSVAFQQSIENAEKYCEDELGVNIAYGQVLIDAHLNLYTNGKITEGQFVHMASTVFLLMNDKRAEFVQDAEAWQLFILCGFMHGRQYQLLQIIESDLATQLKKNDLDPNLRPFITLIYMAAGIDREVHRLGTSEGILPKDTADWETLKLLYWQLRDEKVAKPMQVPSPLGLSSEMRPVFEAVKQYSEFSSRIKITASDLEKIDPQHTGGRILLALAWEKAGYADKTEVLMKQVLLESSGGMPFIQEKASSWLYTFYRLRGRWKEANQVLFAQEVFQSGNPFHGPLAFLEQNKIAKLDGTWTCDVSVRIDGLYEGFTQIIFNGKATISLRSGEIVASIRLADGTQCQVEGRLDELGNATGTFNLLNDKFKVSGKFAPPQIIDSIPELSQLGPMLLGLDKGFRRAVIMFHQLKKSPK
ncbi:MAG: caspase family protein [Chlorobia bacterium]|nr:caspase family protein [Fimbriimonadaceae bacterium]